MHTHPRAQTLKEARLTNPSGLWRSRSRALALWGGRRSTSVEPIRQGAAHLRQHVHQVRRQRTARNALQRLARMLASGGRERDAVMDDSRFEALCEAAAAPSIAQEDVLEDAAVCADALRALAAILAAQPPRRAAGEVARHAEGLARRTSALAAALPAPVRTGAAWAARRLGVAVEEESPLAAATSEIPFHVQINPLAGDALHALDTARLYDEIPFSRDVLVTRNGANVMERRATCWMADEGVGALAYSGKLMQSVPFTPGVAAIRDAVARASGERFDCALINWYEDGSCACAWHSDPDHGDDPPRAKWEQTTVVVACGQTRRFLFRPTPQPDGGAASDVDSHVFNVAHGDLVWMVGHCQDDWQHSVARGELGDGDEPRISIVLKRSHLLPNGIRGHVINERGSRRERREANAANPGKREDNPSRGKTGGRKGRGIGRGVGRGGGGRGRGGARRRR